jgi:hypothetical protein
MTLLTLRIGVLAPVEAAELIVQGAREPEVQLGVSRRDGAVERRLAVSVSSSVDLGGRQNAPVREG